MVACMTAIKTNASLNADYIIIHPLSPHDIKASFYIPENRPNFPTTGLFLNENSHETGLINLT